MNSTEHNIGAKVAAVLAASCMISGCATVHTGNFVDQVDEKGNLVRVGNRELIDGLKISGGVNEGLSTRDFRLIEFSLENRSHKWARLHSVEVDLGNEALNRSVIVTAGDDLVAWAEGMSNRKRIDDYNSRLLMESILAAGYGLAAVGAATGDKGLAIVGGAAALASLSALTVSGVKQGLARVQDVRIFPSTHLLGGAIRLPPGLFQKRWLLLYSPDSGRLPFPSHLYLQYQLDSGENRRVKLDLATVEMR